MANNVYQFSEAFQLKILALIARDRGTFITFRDIVLPKYFRSNIHIDLARIISDHYEEEMKRAKARGTEVMPPSKDVLLEEVRKLCEGSTVKDKLKAQYEAEVSSLCGMDLSDREYIKDSIVGFGKRAALEHAILSSVDIIEKGDDDYSKIEDLITKAIRTGSDISDLGLDYFRDAPERFDTYSKGTDGIVRIPTGLTGVDKILHGGLGGGELGVFVAPPNRGKSIALCNFGANAVAEGKNVAHYTLEMPEKQVAKRYDSRLIGKPFDYLKGEGTNNKALTAILNIQKFQKGKLKIKQYPSNSCSINTIRSHLTRLYMEEGFKPDLIIIDYGDLVQPRKSYKDRRFELESVYLDMRDLAIEYGCPVWTASQTNRGGLDKKIITMADLAEAFNKANIADFMCAMCQSLEEKEDGNFRLFVMKHRDGVASITLPGDIDYPTYKMLVYEEGA